MVKAYIIFAVVGTTNEVVSYLIMIHFYPRSSNVKLIDLNSETE